MRFHVLFATYTVGYFTAPRGYFAVPGANSQMLPEPAQLLEHLGFRNGNLKDSPRVTLGQEKHKGDSPIYYIKLPPMENIRELIVPPPSSLTPNHFHQLNLDFTNNGKPSQIYHWNYKPQIPINNPLEQLHHQFPPLSPISNELIRPMVAMPPEIPLISQIPSQPLKIPTATIVQNPLIALKNNFVYNGRPSGMYIWKPRPFPPRPTKYKHPYFKHFNY